MYKKLLITGLASLLIAISYHQTIARQRTTEACASSRGREVLKTLGNDDVKELEEALEFYDKTLRKINLPRKSLKDLDEVKEGNKTTVSSLRHVLNEYDKALKDCCENTERRIFP